MTASGMPAFNGPNKLTDPGFTPDYTGLIQSDPQYQAVLQQAGAANIANAAQRAAATNRALIQFGLVPSFNGLGLSNDQLGFLNQDVTPDVSALANQNTQNGLSTEAQLQQQNHQQTLRLRNALAARGLLSSGETNYQTGLQEQSFNAAQQKAINDLLNAISGYQGSYLSAAQQAQDQISQALGQAATRQEQLPQNQPIAPSSFSYNPSTGHYEGANGVAYTPHQVGNGYVVVNNATGETHPLDVQTGTIGAPVSAADYFAAHPLQQGSSTQQALQALSNFSGQQVPSSYFATTPTTTAAAPPAAASSAPAAGNSGGRGVNSKQFLI